MKETDTPAAARGLKIIQLEAQNVKRLKAVRIRPDGNLVVIGGENGQGKTSVLDSIMYALGGKSAVCEKPIHEGAESASVTVDLDEFSITRTFTASGGSLSVKKKDGGKVSSPQALLDGLTGRLSFDPLEFSRMEPAKQKATLQQLVGLDFTELDYERKQAFDERTIVNRRLKDAEANLKAAPYHADAPESEVSVSELSAELQKAQDAEVEFERKKGEYERAKRRVEDTKANIARLEAQLAEERKLLEKFEADAAASKDAAENVPEYEIDDIRQRLADAEGINRKVRENARRAELQILVDETREEADGYTQRIEDIDKRKSKALAEAKFPVDGLAFDEHGVTLNGLPFSQASAAEQLRVSVAMGLALNPKLRVMLIRDGSLLDQKSLALVAEMAEQADAQVWMERVGAGAEVSVVIDDGEVMERLTPSAYGPSSPVEAHKEKVIKEAKGGKRRRKVEA